MHPTISEYLMKARQDDALRAGERDRALLEARRVRMTGHPLHRHAGLVRRLRRLLPRISPRL
jgi:hypothetical protein